MAIWTLELIADAVMNHVTDGLQGSPNTPISKEQLRAEVILTRNVIVEMDKMANGASCRESPGFAFLEQQINCISAAAADPSDCCGGVPVPSVMMATIPQVLNMQGTPSISFVGIPARTEFSWAVYYGEGHKSKKWLPGSSTRPYAVLYPPIMGEQKLFVFNAPTDWVALAGLAKLSVTAIFVNPYAKYDYSCCALSGVGLPEDVAPLAASETIVNQIIDQLTQKYINYYRNNNIPITPNDQTDKNT